MLANCYIFFRDHARGIDKLMTKVNEEKSIWYIGCIVVFDLIVFGSHQLSNVKRICFEKLIMSVAIYSAPCGREMQHGDCVLVGHCDSICQDPANFPGLSENVWTFLSASPNKLHNLHEYEIKFLNPTARIAYISWRWHVMNFEMIACHYYLLLLFLVKTK